MTHAATPASRDRAPRALYRAGVAAMFTLLLPTASAHAASGEPDYTELDIRELAGMSAEVTSVARRSQTLLDVPAAAHVITREQIRRSGQTSLPELLRSVPGLHVARLSGNKWAVSARGFNFEFANKLLVLVDGRQLYTPVFGGVFWNAHDVALDDIERIEVIRGPGGSVWGANAVNGVINIITREATADDGNLVRVGGGNEERAFGSLRLAGAAGPRLAYRVQSGFFARDRSVDAGGHATSDEWTGQRFGVRADYLGERDALTFSAGGQLGRAGVSTRNYDASSLATGLPIDTSEDVLIRGSHGLLRWQHPQSEGRRLETLAYYDLAHRRGGLLDEIRHTGSFEVQQELRVGSRHRVILGGGYRFATERTSSSLTITREPDSNHLAFYSAFAQDEIALLHERVALTVGSKLEWNNIADGWEAQPTARALVKLSDDQRLWLSLSRAIRAPSTGSTRSILLLLPPVSPGAGATAVSSLPDPSFEAEVLIAWEAGYRVQLSPELALDVAAFINDYDNLRGVQQAGPNIQLDNRSRGRGRGVEALLEWRPRPWLRLGGSYTGFELDITSDRPSTEEKTFPEHQLKTFASVDLPGNLELDASFARTGSVETEKGLRVHRYPRVDLRLGWQPRAGWEIALVGQNLNDRQHLEYGDLFGAEQGTETQRSVYLQLDRRF